jgi:hypothetical protein
MIENVDWNIDLLVEFSHLWDFKQLALNPAMSGKIFAEFLTEKELIPLLDNLIDK